MARAIVKVRDLMTVNVFVLNPGDKVIKAWEMIQEYGIRHLPVVSSGLLVGMLSYSDLLRLNSVKSMEQGDNVSLSPELADLVVSDVMTRNVISVSPEEELGEVAKHLMENEYHALPVETNSLLIGIITTTDVIRFLLDQFQKDSNQSSLSGANWA